MKWEYESYPRQRGGELRFTDLENVPSIYKYHQQLKIEGLHRLDFNTFADTIHGLMYRGTLINFEHEHGFKVTGLDYYHDLAYTSFTGYSPKEIWDQAMAKLLETETCASFLFKGYWYLIKKQHHLYVHVGDWQFKPVAVTVSETDLPTPQSDHVRAPSLPENNTPKPCPVMA